MFGMNTPAYFAIDNVRFTASDTPDLLCDFDTNTACDVADLDALLYGGIPANDATFDMDGSGTVDLADRDQLYEKMEGRA